MLHHAGSDIFVMVCNGVVYEELPFVVHFEPGLHCQQQTHCPGMAFFSR